MSVEVSKCLAAVPYPYTKKDAEDFIEYAKKAEKEEKAFMLAIVLRENNKVIGGTSIEAINKKDGTCRWRNMAKREISEEWVWYRGI